MTSPSSQVFESYIPVYDDIPKEWEKGRTFLVEQLKIIGNGVNNKTIGFYLDVELLSGNQFIPGVNIQGNASPQQFRQIFRLVVPFGVLTIGLNQRPHGITFDTNFTLIELYAAATNSSNFTAEPIPNGSDTITMDATNINITVSAAWSRCNAVVYYLLEL